MKCEPTFYCPRRFARIEKSQDVLTIKECKETGLTATLKRKTPTCVLKP
jgi:hypothetical protein